MGEGGGALTSSFASLSCPAKVSFASAISSLCSGAVSLVSGSEEGSSVSATRTWAHMQVGGLVMEVNRLKWSWGGVWG